MKVMSKKKKIILVVVILLILVAGGLLAFKLLYHNGKKDVKVTKSLDTIKDFDYKLEDRDTELYKEEFNKLKKNLEGKEIDYEQYAQSIAKMFVIDLYTIDNKINKYDVGGIEFIHPDALENYELNVKDTIYKYVADNSYDDRKQGLPIVKSIKVDNFEQSTFKLKDEEVDSYEVNLSWEYEEDLDYDDEALVVIVQKDKKLYIVQSNYETNEKTD